VWLWWLLCLCLNCSKRLLIVSFPRIEEGGLSAWIKPWVDIANADRAMPYNFKTGDEYKGINIFVLLVGAMEKWVQSHNSWLTFDQAIAMGGSVRKGEKSQHCIRYGVYDKKSKDGKKTMIKNLLLLSLFTFVQC
jgi:antirestriction protein ArdC